MPGARCTRGLVCGCARKELHTSIQVKRRHPASPAQWLYGLYRALLGEPCSVAPVARVMRSITASLTPASGRRDHAISPSARNAVRLMGHIRVHRIPAQRCETTRNAPQADRNRRTIRSILFL